MHVWSIFFISRSVQDWISARAQCRVWAVKQMAFSSRCPLTPSSACRGLATEGMGKSHMNADFFTTCPRVKAYKRREYWRRHKDLWFSLTGSPLAPLHSGCRVQHQSRCGAGNMTPDHWCGSGDGGGGGGEKGGRGVGQTQHYIKPLAWGKCWLQGGDCSVAVEPRHRHCCLPRDLTPLDSVQVLLSEREHNKVQFMIWVEGEGWPVIHLWLHLECCFPVTTLLGCGSRDVSYLHLGLPFIAPSLNV